MKLYFVYRLNNVRKSDKDKVHRFYLFTGENMSQGEIQERMEQEIQFLLEAGVELDL
jgi:hypothetical protein